MQVTQEKLISIQLSEDEARWLQSFVQNYPGSFLNPNTEEDEIHQRHRFNLFEALKDVLSRVD